MDLTRAGVESRDWEDSLKHDLLLEIARGRQSSLSVCCRSSLVTTATLLHRPGRGWDGGRCCLGCGWLNCEIYKEQTRARILN